MERKFINFKTQRRRRQKSKTGVSVVPQKGLMSSKTFEKRRKFIEFMESDKSLNHKLGLN